MSLFAMLSLRKEQIEDLEEEEARPMTRADADEITVEDAFPADEGGPAGGRAGVSTPRGLAIAAAWFAPTFLAVFLGLPYLVGSAGPAPSPAVPSSETAAPLAEATAPTQPGASPWDPLRALLWGPTPGGLEPPAGDVPPGLTPGRPASASGEGSAPAGASESADLAPPPSAVQSPPAALTLPPPTTPSEAPQSAGSSHPERESRPAPDPAPTVRARPSRPPESSRGDWMPAAAFTGREAASRLAASIERQGYPVQVRRDGSGARPWVVWIGSQPDGGGHR